jgi:hypothetical protein
MTIKQLAEHVVDQWPKTRDEQINWLYVHLVEAKVRARFDMRERCRLAAANWIDPKRTADENQLINAVCGDIAVISVEE